MQTTPRVNGIDASYYYVKDMNRAVVFYTALLGAEPTMRFGDMACEWTLSDGGTFGLYNPGEDEGGFRPGGGVMFNVDDVADAVRAAKDRGVTFYGEVDETPMCHMAFGEDTEGNGFLFHHPKAAS